MAYFQRFLVTTSLVFWLVSVVSAATVYDVNGDGKEGLAETIHSLQVTAGLVPAPPYPSSYTNSNGMTFNLIPSGTFTMGSPVTELGRNAGETEHQVTLSKSFYIQTTEVTQKQWQDIIGNNPAYYPIGEEYPIETVNWFEAAYFANALSIAEGRSECYSMTGCTPIPGNDMECTDVAINTRCTGYRLPTEAEWEYTARATTTTPWSYLYSYDTSATGETIGHGFNPNLDAMGWYGFNNIGGDLFRTVPGYPGGTKPVAKKQANKWGLYDMHGNVSEWCQDWFDVYPGDITNPQGPDTPSVVYGSFRVLRGGGYIEYASFARSANRKTDVPGDSYHSHGFRLVLAMLTI